MSNKERTQKLQKKWREKNPDRVKELAKEWREKNPDRVKAQSKKWREKNPDRVKELAKEWRANNKEKQNNIIKELLFQYYHSCIHNYQYRMQVFNKLLDYKVSSLKRVGENFKKLIDSIPVLYIEHVVFFYYDYFCRHYKTEDSQKIHLEEMIHLAKKQNILFPEELSYTTYGEQQRVIFYILFQMSEKHHASYEEEDDYVLTLEKAGFKTGFITVPFPWEG